MIKNIRKRRAKASEKEGLEEEEASSFNEDERANEITRSVVSSSERSRSVTFDPFRLYLEEIKRYPLLSREEERELAIRYREKEDMEAGYRLITANLRLVVKIAMDFQRYWMQNLNDLIQEGNVGLMQAVKKFEIGRAHV